MNDAKEDSKDIAFPGLVDLESERVGGTALVANDEFFGPKEALLRPGRGVSIPGKYNEEGKWVDGWEMRRKRTPRHDSCIIRLGLPGAIQLINVDTNHFLGNHPACTSVETCSLAQEISLEELISKTSHWREILPRSPLRPGSMNLFPVTSQDRATHLRLNIYPDGGVARFRAYGKVVPDWERIAADGPVDLVALANGGTAVAASDSFFSSPENLILQGGSVNMGNGWETRRRRQLGDDWAVLKAGRTGFVKKLEIETRRFKGNYPAGCSVEICYQPEPEIDVLTVSGLEWVEILPRTPLRPDSTHVFEEE